VEWPQIASVIDQMILKLKGTREPVKDIAREAQQKLNHLSSQTRANH
jgi:hypothetical protein